MTAVQLWSANDMLSNREQAITLTKNGHVRWHIKALQGLQFKLTIYYTKSFDNTQMSQMI